MISNIKPIISIYFILHFWCNETWIRRSHYYRRPYWMVFHKGLQISSMSTLHPESTWRLDKAHVSTAGMQYCVSNNFTEDNKWRMFLFLLKLTVSNWCHQRSKCTCHLCEYELSFTMKTDTNLFLTLIKYYHISYMQVFVKGAVAVMHIYSMYALLSSLIKVSWTEVEAVDHLVCHLWTKLKPVMTWWAAHITDLVIHMVCASQLFYIVH